jgi:hypothetical protein
MYLANTTHHHPKQDLFARTNDYFFIAKEAQHRPYMVDMYNLSQLQIYDGALRLYLQ